MEENTTLVENESRSSGVTVDVVMLAVAFALHVTKDTKT